MSRSLLCQLCSTRCALRERPCYLVTVRTQNKRCILNTRFHKLMLLFIGDTGSYEEYTRVTSSTQSAFVGRWWSLQHAHTKQVSHENIPHINQVLCFCELSWWTCFYWTCKASCVLLSLLVKVSRRDFKRCTRWSGSVIGEWKQPSIIRELVFVFRSFCNASVVYLCNQQMICLKCVECVVNITRVTRLIWKTNLTSSLSNKVLCISSLLSDGVLELCQSNE